MEPVPDAISRRLFPGERVIWFEKSRATRVRFSAPGIIAAAIAWYLYLREVYIVVSLVLLIIIVYPILLQVSTYYVLTDSRVIAISLILPPRVLYLNLINELGAPVPIKLGWYGIRFGASFPRQEDQFNRLVGGPIKTSFSFMALED